MSIRQGSEKWLVTSASAFRTIFDTLEQSLLIHLIITCFQQVKKERNTMNQTTQDDSTPSYEDTPHKNTPSTASPSTEDHPEDNEEDAPFYETKVRKNSHSHSHSSQKPHLINRTVTLPSVSPARGPAVS